MAVVNFTLFCLPINLVVFYKKNNQGKQDIFTAIGLFSNESGKSGRNGKSGKYIFRKKWAHSITEPKYRTIKIVPFDKTTKHFI